MSAASTDYFTHVGVPGTATTLSAPGHTIAGTTINVVSTSNWSTDTGVVFAIDTVTLVNGVEVRDSGSYTEWEGVVTSGTIVGSMVLRTGTDQNYPAGSTTRVYIPVASARENRLVDGILVAHNQDGTLKANAVTTTSITDSNVTTAKILDLNVTNAKLAQNVAWTSWTPTWTNLTVGNGTVTAKYQQIGKTVICNLVIVLGSTSSVTGTVAFTVPVTAASRYGTDLYVPGKSYMEDVGVNGYHGGVFNSTATGTVSTTVFRPFVLITSGAYAVDTAVGTTVPFTFATGDKIGCSFEYEAA
jgi:hypothetical protein